MKVRVYDSITRVGATEWSRVSSAAFPFARYHFLEALETTDCLGVRTGWHPRIVTAETGGRVAAAGIAYVRTNSWGEYVFDFAWAEGAARAGLAYYPKLTAAIPFTPATGPKILVDPALPSDERRRAEGLVRAAFGELAAGGEMSSVHALFLPPGEIEHWREDGYLIREGYQFHWRNNGYATFDDFLSALKGKRRREIRRERGRVASAGLTIRRITDEALGTARAQQFYEFYLSTIDKRAGFPYLTRRFFETVFETFKDQILLVLAENDAGEAIAGALNYFDEHTLYGRHWGGRGDYHSLHFECCYYQGIEFAIERGLTLFEAGAQGEHKLQRGFLPVPTYSAHLIHDPHLGAAVAHFVAEETRHVRAEMKSLDAHSPYGTAGASAE